MKRSDQYQEIRTLTDAVIDKQASDSQVKRLKQLLASDTASQDFYFDYVGVHTRLKESAAHNIEFVYRRLTEEELIVRPAGHSDEKKDDKQNKIVPADEDISDLYPPTLTAPTKSIRISDRSKWLMALLAFLAILWALISWFINDSKPESFRAILFSGEASIGDFGQIKGHHLLAGEYHIKQKSSIGFQTGETLNLVENSVITLLSNNKIELVEGAISIIPVPNNSIEVLTNNFAVYSNGAPLSVDLRNGKPIIKSGERTSFSPNRWRPKHYWSFDGNSDRAVDSAGNADGVVYSPAIRVQGLVGDGAFLFDNSKNIRLNLGNGGGSVLGSGSFSAFDGITIEAVVKTDYSGLKGDEDHIFRKGGTDGQFRILLSLQNDKGPKSYLRPEGQFKESLSFGLFILGQGYHELKLPLDGADGRPSLDDLKDENFHHIVATYNVSTGLKAIYIDGKPLASYQYPPGSKLVSGGKGEANIGNAPNYPKSDKYLLSPAFTGVIDEVAFYDYALPALMVENHFEQIQQGYNYFGLTPSSMPLPQIIKLPLPSSSMIELEPMTGLIYRVVTDSKYN